MQTILQEVIESLQRSPREAKYYSALYYAYLRPALTQEQAAEMLDISVATFRRYLKAGIARAIDILWYQEIDGLGN